MKFVIISYKRSERVITANWAKSAIIVVPESQRVDYEKNNKNEILAIPDREDGNCAKKKNAVLNRFVNENVVILDDDISNMGYHEGNVMNNATEGEFLNMVENMFVMLEELEIVLGGVNVQSDKKFYREYSPFSLNSVVLGPCTIIRNVDKEVRFDSDNLWLKEDYDMSLSVLKKYRKILRFNKWYYLSKHITNSGGLSGKRNLLEEQRQNLLLQKKWGSKLVKVERKTQAGNKTINPIVTSPIKGI